MKRDEKPSQSNTKSVRGGKNPALKITLIYFVIGVAWILFSDLLLSYLVREHAAFVRLQTVKGWFYIFVTALILYLLIAGNFKETRRSEVKLRESEARYKSLVETTSDWVWEIDENAVYTYASPKIKDILGYRPDEIIGKTPFSLMPPDEAERLSKIFKQIEAEHKPFRLLDNVNLAKDGRRVVLETSGTPIFDAEGKFRGYRGIDRDVTDRKEAEAKLKETDKRIRHAYVDVIYAVTGGRLIIATPEDVEASLGRRITPVESISSFEELSKARSNLQTAIGENFPELKDTDELVISISEALTNGIKHAGGAEYALYRSEDMAQVLISDQGPGIDFDALAKATLLAGYSTKGTLGIGFSVMLEFCDRVMLSTEPGRTWVVLEKKANAGEIDVDAHYPAVS